MAVFIEKGQAALTYRQATKRGKAHMLRELGQAGARPGDMAIFNGVPHADLPPRLTHVLANLPGSPATYADYATAWEADNVVNGERNQFNSWLAAYRKATARLAQYRVADGRPEVTGQQATGEYDESGEPITETVVVQTAIEPVEPTAEKPVYDDEGNQTGTETITNPLIVEDEAERAHAQGVIDATPQEVKDWS